MNYFNLAAPCGKDCFNCPLYTDEENHTNREALLKRKNIRTDKFFPCRRPQHLAVRAERLPHSLNIFNLCMIQKLGVEKWATEHSKQIFNDY